MKTKKLINGLATMAFGMTVVILSPSQSQAAEGETFTIDQLNYTVLTEEGSTGTVSVWKNANATISGTLTIPASVENDGVKYSVTSFGDNAFQDCKDLTKVNIPNSVTTINNGAFRECSKLNNVTIPDSVTSIAHAAFHRCSSLTSIKIPDKVGDIGPRAFSYCTSLTSVTLGKSLKTIGQETFSKCTSLKNIVIPDSVYTLGFPGYGGVFNGCESLTNITWGSGLTYIAESTFRGCSKLTSVVIPNSVTSVGENVFQYCSGLTNAVLGTGMTSTGKGIFYQCQNLVSVTIPENITSIDDWAFSTCTSLASIKLPDGLTSIGDYAFINCKKLTSIKIPNGVTSIGACAFSDCEGLTGIKIPDSVTTMGRSVFSGCTGLTRVDIPNSVTTLVSDYLFSGCSKLMYVTLPDGITSIDSNAFAGCGKLVEITIPESVTTIGGDAFSGCSSLTSIVIPKSVSFIDGGAFSKCGNLTAVYFRGNATKLQVSAWDWVNPFPSPSVSVIYRIDGTTGWTNPWCDRPVEEWIVAPEIEVQPKSQLTFEGYSTIPFSVSGIGTKPWSYQWYKDGEAISNATEATYAVENVQMSDAGEYTVVVSNSVGSVTSEVMTLTVQEAPLFRPGFMVSYYPSNKSISNVNDAETCIVTPSQWKSDPMTGLYYDVINFSDSSNDTTHFADPVLFPGDNGDNFVILAETDVVIPEAGNWSFGVYSDDGFKLNITGNDVNFSSAYTEGRAGSDTISTFNFPTEGIYHIRLLYFEATGGASLKFYAGKGSYNSFSDTFRLLGDTENGGLLVGIGTLEEPPVITEQPQSQNVAEGDDVTFSVTAEGDNLSYQWFMEGLEILGATDSSYTIENVQITHSGHYKVIVYNNAGSEESWDAILRVNAILHPAIITQPVSQTVDEGDSVTFFVEATGTGPLWYQWYKDYEPISGATDPSYTIEKAQMSDAGKYMVVVQNSVWADESNLAILTVNKPVVSDGTAVRSVKVDGQTATVTLVLTPGEDVSVYFVEETVPDIGTVVPGNGGVYTPSKNVIRWSFLDGVARTVSYTVTAPADFSEKVTVSGEVAFDMTVKAIEGETVLDFTVKTHPADTNDDFEISMLEVSAYAVAWKQGKSWSREPADIPMNYVARGALIWINGGDYIYDSCKAKPACWVNAVTKAAAVELASADVPERKINVTNGKANVAIEIVPEEGISVYFVEEQLPADVTLNVTDISDGGNYIPEKNVIRWSFLDGEARTLTYAIEPEAGFEGTLTLSGEVMLDEETFTIEGDIEAIFGPAINFVVEDDGETLVLDFEGILYESDDAVNWRIVEGAKAPFKVDTSHGKKFYRSVK